MYKLTNLNNTLMFWLLVSIGLYNIGKNAPYLYKEMKELFN